jgi:transglutaminase-like putative cysteine protease
MLCLSLLRLAPAWAVLLALTASLSGAPRWGDVTADDFAKAPALIDPDAGAEIMFMEASMDESTANDIRWTYFIRVRLVDERGVGRYRKIELPFDDTMSVSAIEARTYKPDGSVLVLDKKEIFERDLVKTRARRRSVKSFAPAGLEPGVILEYRYVERRERITPLWPLHFQRDVPVRLVRYRLKPYPVPGYDIRCISFNLPQFSLKPDAQGFFTLEAASLKGWKNEPFQFPPIQMQAAALIYFSPQDGLSTEAFWAKVARQLYARTEAVAKPTKAVRRALSGMISPSDSPEEKLRKIHDAVRTKIVNHDLDRSGFSGEQRRKLPKNDTAEETLERGHGTGDDLVIAFVALARAAGLDARLAQTNDRTFILYNDKMREPFVFRKLVAAVRLGESWTFCDPGAVYLPAGMIDWRYTGTSALVADPERALLPFVPLTPAAGTVRTRKAAFVLDEHGTLEGQVTVTATGYFDFTTKNRYDALAAEEREKNLKEEIQKQFPLAELSEVAFAHTDDPLHPLVLSYRIRVPDFAERTGARLFVLPAVLYKGIPPAFDAAERRSPVMFNHLYREADSIEIVVPAAYKLEAGSAPPDLDLGKLGRYEVKVSYVPIDAKIIYAREFELTAPGVPLKFYPVLKRVFEELTERDNHTLTFRTTAEADSSDAVLPVGTDTAGKSE